jgi:hypothetical protein
VANRNREPFNRRQTRLDLSYKIVVWKFFVAQTQAEQSRFPTTMLTTKPTHLLLLLPPRPAAAAAARNIVRTIWRLFGELVL